MTSDRSSRDSCLKFLGCGCFLLIVLGLIGGFAGWSWFGQIAENAEVAEEGQQELDALYGGLGEWRPAPDWSLDDDRLDAFLRIRTGLMEPCTEISAFFGRIEDLEAGAEDGEEPGFLDALSIVGPAFGLPRKMTRFVGERNRLLAEERMGLGEYAFLYVLTLHAGPAQTTATEEGDGLSFGALDHDARQAFVDGLDGVAAAIADRDPELAERLVAERERLENDEGALPFAEGLPETWRPPIEARRRELEETRCPVSDDIALTVIERRGASIHFD